MSLLEVLVHHSEALSDRQPIIVYLRGSVTNSYLFHGWWKFPMLIAYRQYTEPSSLSMIDWNGFCKSTIDFPLCDIIAIV